MTLTDANPIPDGRPIAQRHDVVVGAEDVVLLQREGALRDLVESVEPTEQCLASADLARQRTGTGNVPDHLAVDQSGEGLSIACAKRVRGSTVRGYVRVLHRADYPARPASGPPTSPTRSTPRYRTYRGLVQRRGGSIEVIRPRDRVFFEPGEDHWHGAAPTRFMSHLSMVEVDDSGNSVTWGRHVSDEEYGAPPSIGTRTVLR
jgi:hypothetical protein